MIEIVLAVSGSLGIVFLILGAYSEHTIRKAMNARMDRVERWIRYYDHETNEGDE